MYVRINVRLTDNSLYNRFCIERSPKIGFWGDFGVGAKIFSGNTIGMQRPPIYAFSGIVDPDLTPRAVAFCMDIAISIGEIWASLEVLSSPTRSRRKSFGPNHNHNHKTYL